MVKLPNPQNLEKRFTNQEIAHLFSEKYELDYLEGIDPEYLEVESIEMMNFRHNIEALELKKLQVKQKDSLIKRLASSNKIGVKEVTKRTAFGISPTPLSRLAEVAETAEEEMDHHRERSFDASRKSGDSGEGLDNISGGVLNSPVDINDHRILETEDARHLLESLTQADIISEVQRPISHLLSRDQSTQNPIEVRRLQLAIHILIPESLMLPTGHFGLTTERFVKQIQKEMNIEEEGKVSIELWRVLGGRVYS